MSIFVPEGYTTFLKVLEGLGDSKHERLRQALYAEKVKAVVMIPGGNLMPIKAENWGDDRTWRLAVQRGNGNVVTGDFYFPSVEEGPVLLPESDLLSLQQVGKPTCSGGHAAPAFDAEVDAKNEDAEVNCATDDQGLARKPVSRRELKVWYVDRVKQWPAHQRHPSRENDLADAKRHFDDRSIDRAYLRSLRKDFAEAWTKAGPPKRN